MLDDEVVCSRKLEGLPQLLFELIEGLVIGVFELFCRSLQRLGAAGDVLAANGDEQVHQWPLISEHRLGLLALGEIYFVRKILIIHEVLLIYLGAGLLQFEQKLLYDVGLLIKSLLVLQ